MGDGKPLTMKVAAGPGVTVSLKVVEGLPLALAVIVKTPREPFAVKAGLVAMPVGSSGQTAIVALMRLQFPPAGKVAFAPPVPVVIVNVTCPPTTGSLCVLARVRVTGAAKAVFAAVD